MTDKNTFEPTTAESDQSSAVRGGLILPSALTIREVLKLHGEWLAFVTGKGEVCIDAGAVEEIDTAGLQLLLCLVREIVGRGRTITWSGASDKFIEITRALAMNASFGIE